MNALIPISALIGDRTYRIKTSAAEEEALRNIIKLINAKIVEFKTQFSGRDMQDYVAMVLLWLATEKALSNINIDYGNIEKLDQIENLLNKLV